MRVQYDGTVAIQAARDAVAAFVTDPDRVGRCLPDLQDLQVADERRFTAFVRIGVGPVRGQFKMEIELDPNPSGDEIGMRLKGSGMGSGLQMTSRMRLADGAAGGTELRWQAEATISGPLAAVGGRLLDGQARKVIEQLFTNIRQALEAGAPAGSVGGG